MYIVFERYTLKCVNLSARVNGNCSNKMLIVTNKIKISYFSVLFPNTKRLWQRIEKYFKVQSG